MSYLTAALSEIREKYAKDKNAKSDKTSSAANFGTIGIFVSGTDSSNSGDWDDQDRQTAYDERAAIMEIDGGLSRAEAEKLARAAMPARNSGED